MPVNVLESDRSKGSSGHVGWEGKCAAHLFNRHQRRTAAEAKGDK